MLPYDKFDGKTQHIQKELRQAFVERVKKITYSHTPQVRTMTPSQLTMSAHYLPSSIQLNDTQPRGQAVKIPTETSDIRTCLDTTKTKDKSVTFYTKSDTEYFSCEEHADFKQNFFSKGFHRVLQINNNIGKFYRRWKSWNQPTYRKDIVPRQLPDRNQICRKLSKILESFSTMTQLPLVTPDNYH